jgi:hypothetical protein
MDALTDMRRYDDDGMASLRVVLFGFTVQTTSSTMVGLMFLLLLRSVPIQIEHLTVCDSAVCWCVSVLRGLGVGCMGSGQCESDGEWGFGSSSCLSSSVASAEANQQ